VKPFAVGDRNVVEAMNVCVKKIETLATSLQQKELPEVNVILIKAPPKDVTQQQPGEVTNILVVNPAVLPAYNTRVKLKPVEFEYYEGEGI
jgi:hypothetical protein